LMMRWFDTGRKALAVAAVDSGAGTSTLVANLAVVFSQLKLRTLVIDANFRRPRQHHLFGIDGNIGMTDLLAGRVGMEAIVSPNAIPFLSVLPAGTPAPNASDLVGHGMFMELQTTLPDLFDIILVDTPSFADTADAHSIASRVGGVLIVMRKDRTRMVDVAALHAQLPGTGVVGVGSVVVEY
jgi:protein-tyrosine kinase